MGLWQAWIHCTFPKRNQRSSPLLVPKYSDLFVQATLPVYEDFSSPTWLKRNWMCWGRINKSGGKTACNVTQLTHYNRWLSLHQWWSKNIHGTEQSVSLSRQTEFLTTARTPREQPGTCVPPHGLWCTVDTFHHPHSSPKQPKPMCCCHSSLWSVWPAHRSYLSPVLLGLLCGWHRRHCTAWNGQRSRGRIHPRKITLSRIKKERKKKA